MKKENINNEIKWWKPTAKYMGILTVVFSILSGTYLFTERLYEYKELKEIVESIDVINGIQGKSIKNIEKYVLSKKKSFAVGFRVFNDTDIETGVVTKRKMYRDWNGVWNEVYLDVEYTSQIGIDYYFYIDKRTGDKVYCW